MELVLGLHIVVRMESQKGLCLHSPGAPNWFWRPDLETGKSNLTPWVRRHGAGPAAPTLSYVPGVHPRASDQGRAGQVYGE